MAAQFEEIQLRFLQMLDDGRHIFDAASNALVGGTAPDAIREDLFTTDKRINETEQEIRRMIVVHGSVHGARTFPSLLVMMSLAKDAERIGDYAKNLFDLAASGVTLGDEVATLTELKDKVSTLLVKAKNLHQTHDEGGARGFLADADRIEDACDAAVKRLILHDGANVAASALTYRYLKRVTSHASNMVTALVVPLDKLDFFEED